MEVQKFKDIKVSNIKFTDSKFIYGRRYVNIYYSKQQLMVHFPKVFLPFGLSEYSGKFSLDFRLSKTDPKCKEMIDKVLEIEQYVQKFAKDNMKEWFQTKKGNINFKSSISNNLNFPPIFKSKIKQSQDEIKTKCYDDSKNEIDLKSIEKSDNIKGILECSGIWINSENGKHTYGITWKVSQLSKYPKVSTKIPLVVMDDEYLIGSSDTEDEVDEAGDGFLSDSE